MNGSQAGKHALPAICSAGSSGAIVTVKGVKHDVWSISAQSRRVLREYEHKCGFNHLLLSDQRGSVSSQLEIHLPRTIIILSGLDPGARWIN